MQTHFGEFEVYLELAKLKAVLKLEPLKRISPLSVWNITSFVFPFPWETETEETDDGPLALDLNSA